MRKFLTFLIALASIIFAVCSPASAQQSILGFPPGMFQNKAAQGGTAWTPAQLPNLIAWYKADVGVYTDTACSTPATNSTTVGCWKDQSGNGYDLKQALTGKPTYLSAGLNGKPTIQHTAATPTGMITA